MSKALRLPPSMKSSFETASKTIIAPVTQQNQTIEMRRVGGSKGAFRTRLPQNLTVCSYKIDVFLWLFQIFPNEPRNLLPQNQCFVRGFCQFSSHVTKRHACHTICTFSPLDAPLTMRFAKKTRFTKCCAATGNEHGHVQSAAPAATNASHLLTPCWNVTKCHACLTKRGYMTFETSKSDHFCSIPQALPEDPTCGRAANGCETRPPK